MEIQGMQVLSSVQGLNFQLYPSSYNTGSYTNPTYDAYKSTYTIDTAYVLGQDFFSSATFNGRSLASEGFTVNGLVGTWSIIGTSEVINVYVGAASVPGPLPLLGVGAAFGWSRRLRKRIVTPLITPPQA
jgi:MYXO-CTERM domain-containing protein